LGLGDLLLAIAFPLVLCKAYSRSVGVAALALGSLGIMLLLVSSGVVRSTLLALVVLGPLMVLFYLSCMRLRGPERTMRQYWQTRAPQQAVTTESAESLR
jgi:hypothetical protein